MNEEIKKTIEVLKSGGVAVIPTDTVYGLAASIESEEGIRRIYDIKKRVTDKPLALLIDSVDWVWKWVKKTKELEEMCQKYWPGAATLIMNTRKGETIGLRIPDHEPLIAVLEETGPLCATSANMSGMATPKTIEDVPDQIKEGCDIVADFSPKPAGISSRIIDIREGKNKVTRN